MARTWDYLSGVPAAGHVVGSGYWHPGSAATCHRCHPAPQVWGWVDSRTGKRVSVTSTSTREQAEATLEGWRARDRRGGRSDLHDVLPHLVVVRIR